MIPSVIATTAADGTPNVSYLSHVVKVDDAHVAISNQFFAKTAANVRANRSATLLLVCPRTGDQYSLDLSWEKLLDDGPIFDRMDRALRAAIAQTGMARIMRLKAVDIFRVNEIHAVPSALLRNEIPAVTEGPSMRTLAEMTARSAEATSAEDLFDKLMRDACVLTGCANSLVLVHEPERSVLVTAASRGYTEPAAGAEVAIGEMLIGEAAAGRTTLKFNDLSRLCRMGHAASGGAPAVDDERTISLPQLSGAMSQIAVPMSTRGELLGVLFLESERRLAFDDEAAASLEALVRQASSTLTLVESRSSRESGVEARTVATKASGRTLSITVYRFDDSVFIDGRYVIKGVAGRLLVHLIECALAEGRNTFTNREIRLSFELRLPEFKDNLETRLLLLARRLEDQAFPIRLLRHRRGVMALQIDGNPVIRYAD
uniref:GAF domain-containing protein n=1 Tax=Altererythrobacter segetis TaxID=1104773 RepID=UPI001A9C898D|nr:GAF domain-containing protein [Altererythrobacter segetis]